jgi:hypothetical protein
MGPCFIVVCVTVTTPCPIQRQQQSLPPREGKRCIDRWTTARCRCRCRYSVSGFTTRQRRNQIPGDTHVTYFALVSLLIIPAFSYSTVLLFVFRIHVHFHSSQHEPHSHSIAIATATLCLLLPATGHIMVIDMGMATA